MRKGAGANARGAGRAANSFAGGNFFSSASRGGRLSHKQRQRPLIGGVSPLGFVDYVGERHADARPADNFSRALSRARAGQVNRIAIRPVRKLAWRRRPPERLTRAETRPVDVAAPRVVHAGGSWSLSFIIIIVHHRRRYHHHRRSSSFSLLSVDPQLGESLLFDTLQNALVCAGEETRGRAARRLSGRRRFARSSSRRATVRASPCSGSPPQAALAFPACWLTGCVAGQRRRRDHRSVGRHGCRRRGGSSALSSWPLSTIGRRR